MSGDFPAVRQLVAEAVSPVLRLRGGGVEAEAPSPAPAPPLYPLPLDAARRAATAAAADAMDGVPPVSMEGRRVRRARDVFDPSTEWARPQYGGELDRRRVQRELEKLAAREGADFGDLGLDDVVEKLADHMRRSLDEVQQHVEVIAEVLERDDELSPEQLLLQDRPSRLFRETPVLQNTHRFTFELQSPHKLASTRAPGAPCLNLHPVAAHHCVHA